MKKLFLILALAACTNIYSADIKNPETVIREGDPEMKKRQLEWIDMQHKAEPGVDWRIIETENRLSRHKLRMDQLQKYLSKGNKNLPLSETVADGKIEGTWIEKGSNNQAGRVHYSYIDRSRHLLYTATSGGHVFRCTLGEDDWQCLNNGMKINDIRTMFVMRLADRARIFVVGNSPAIAYYSDDEGLTWHRSEGLETPYNSGAFYRGVVTNDDSKTIYIYSRIWDGTARKNYGHIFKSTDFGVTFEPCVEKLDHFNMTDIWAAKYGGANVYVLNGTNFYKLSKDDSLYFVDSIALEQDIADMDKVMLYGSEPEDGKYFYAAYTTRGGVPSATYFYVSELNGKDWYYTSFLPEKPFMHNSFAASTQDPDIVYFGAVHFYRSYTRAFDWDSVNRWPEYYPRPHDRLHADIPGINTYRDLQGNEEVLINTDGGLYISYDNMQTVKNISLKNLNVGQYYSVYTHRKMPGVIYLGSQDQGFQRTLVDTGKTLSFEQTISGDYGHLTSSDDGHTLWSVYPNMILFYIGAENESISTKAYWQFEGSGWLWLSPILADPGDPNTAYMVSGGKDGSSNVWKMNFDYTKITGQMLPYNFREDGKDKISSIAISPFDNNTFYALTTEGYFYKSADKGMSWKKTEDFDSEFRNNFSGLSILPSQFDKNKIIISGGGYSNPGAFITLDEGETFLPMSEGLPSTTVFDLAANADETLIFAATQSGPYVYIVEDSMWYNIQGLTGPDQAYRSVEFIPGYNTARFATYGRGLWDFRIDAVISVVQSEKLNKNLSISAAPIPAENHTIINISSDKPIDATIHIYDMEGRIIRNLSQYLYESKNNLIRWDCTDDIGNSVPTGAYICTVSADGLTRYVKITVNR